MFGMNKYCSIFSLLGILVTWNKKIMKNFKTQLQKKVNITLINIQQRKAINKM